MPYLVSYFMSEIKTCQSVQLELSIEFISGFKTTLILRPGDWMWLNAKCVPVFRTHAHKNYISIIIYTYIYIYFLTSCVLTLYPMMHA